LPANPNSPDAKIVGDAAPQELGAPAQPVDTPSATATAPATKNELALPVRPQPVAAQPSAPVPAKVETPSPAAQPAPAAGPAQTAAAPSTQAPAPAIAKQQDAPPPSAAAAAPVAAPSVPAPSADAVAASQPAKLAAVANTTVVEIMALSHESDADAMVSALRRHGYNPSVNHDTQDSLLHLDLGPFPSRTEAEAVRQRLVQDGYDATLR
jgi:cell division septation protein DedD